MITPALKQLSFGRVSSAIVWATKEDKMVLASHSGIDGDARLSLAMDKYLEGRMEASKMSHKYKVVRKWREACRTL